MIDVNKVIAYESGEMEEDEMIEFFQGLVNSGMAWQLQGHYGRTASQMILAGLITQPIPPNNESVALLEAVRWIEAEVGNDPFTFSHARMVENRLIVQGFNVGYDAVLTAWTKRIAAKELANEGSPMIDAHQATILKNRLVQRYLLVVTYEEAMQLWKFWK